VFVGVLVWVGVVVGVLLGGAVVLLLLSLPLAAVFGARGRGSE
jgi:hypothetical protein